MQRQVILTADGSATVEIPELGVTYHSRRGAVQESVHVFVEAGLHYAMAAFPGHPLSVFEMGFGSGLNALLTCIDAEAKGIGVDYFAVEAFPLSLAETDALNYGELSGERALFRRLHEGAWSMETRISDQFVLTKEEAKLQDLELPQRFHVIYYDAFAPAAQPDLWTETIFRKLYAMLLPGGILTTYCSKGDVRRAMQAAGFSIEKIPGPPGKREMVRAKRRTEEQ